jgi:protein-disulfide isomerase
MMPTGRKYTMDLSQEPVAGDPKAKVKLVAVTCPRCPYCAVLIRGLYQEVTRGSLKGKVRMQSRLFPLRSHPGSTEASMAVMAAKEFGKFWPYLIHLYKNFDRFDPKKLPECAATQGMERQRFERLLRDKKLRAQLVASKKEGVRNAIDATPTLFINGRRYQGELDLRSVVDVLEEEHDRVTGKK